jgi:hypothetical protein
MLLDSPIYVHELAENWRSTLSDKLVNDSPSPVICNILLNVRQ